MWDNSVKWDSYIRPIKGWIHVDIRELLRYRDLILLLVKRNFKLLYKQTVLGPAWVVLQPLITTIVFTVIFGGIAKLPTDGMPSFLFYMAGNIAWQYFSSCLTQTSGTFIQNRQLFGKVYFPRLVMPISVVCTQLINFLVQFAMFLVFLIYYATRAGTIVRPDFALIPFTPLILLQMAALGLGFGIIVSALTTKYRDLAMLVTFGVHLWMYATPIAYSSSLIYESYPALAGLYMLNPMTPMIELFRSAFLGVPASGMQYYWISWITTIAVLVLGAALFTRVEKTFMDTV
ncbi:MAG: ABC transporter permease [Christensenellales bacterium]